MTGLLQIRGPRFVAVRPGLVTQTCGHQAREHRDFPITDETAAAAWIEERAGLDLFHSMEEKTMGIFVGAPRYENAPEGLHPAVCCDVIDLGIVKTQFGDKHMVRLVWQIEATNKDGRRFTPGRQFTASLDRRANLRKVLEGWRGRAFTAAEEEKFDLENLLEKCCQIQIQHVPADGGKVYANVVTVVPYPKGMDALKVVDYVRKKDRVGDATPPEDQEQPADDVPF